MRERDLLIEWYAMMIGAGAALGKSRRSSLENWERENSGRTSDWPGWTPLIGPRPAGIGPRSRKITAKVPIPMDLRWRVWERDNFTCLGCGTRRRLSVDHILAESLGGTLRLDNLQTLCCSCNSKKGAR